MGWFDHDDTHERRAYEEVQYAGEEHKAKLSHELIGGAAAFAAMKAYQDHQEANGKPQSFEMAKNIIAGLAGMEADKLIETKGLDAIDRQRAKHEAEERAKNALAQSQQYGRQEYQPRPYEGGPQNGYGGPQGGYGGPPGGFGGPQGGFGRPGGPGGPGGYGGPHGPGGYGPPGGPGGPGGYGPPGGPGGYGGGYGREQGRW